MNIKKIVSAVTAFALSATMFAGFSIQANAADTEIEPTLATYVDYNNADVSSSGATEYKAGYNSFTDGTIAFPNNGWGCSWVTYLKFDTSSIDGTITAANLTFTATDSTDGKRAANIVVGYIGNTSWDNNLTYTTANSAGMLSGVTQLATVIAPSKNNNNGAVETTEGLTANVSNAFVGDGDGIVTLVLLATNAAGTTITVPKLSVTYTPKGATTTDILVTTTPYAGITVNGNTIYADSTGAATLTGIEIGAALNYTISKYGYNSYEGSIASVLAGSNIQQMLTMSEGVIFAEDFSALTNWGMSVNSSEEVVEKGMLVHKPLDAGNYTYLKTRGAYKALSAATLNDGFVIDFDWYTGTPANGSAHNISFADASGEVLFGVVQSSSSKNMTAYTGGDFPTGSNVNNNNSGVVVDGAENVLAKSTRGTTQHINAVVDYAAKKVTVKCGANTPVVLNLSGTYNKQISGVKIYTGKLLSGLDYQKIDNLMICDYTSTVPVLTVTKTSDVITSVPTTGTVSAQPVTDGVLGKAEDVNLTDVTTLYIKVKNPTAAIPTVTLNNAEKTPVKSTRTTDVATTVGTDTYFVYQFVGVDASELTGATVSYDGAADVIL